MTFRPRLLNPIIDVAIPWNVLEEAADVREKVRKIGYIGRGAAIFQTSRLIVYLHGDYDQKEVDFLVKNLKYLSTPPHLRKLLFKLEPELRFSGLLPPLKTPAHVSKPDVGSVVEGVVIRWYGYYSIVKIGNECYAKVPRPYPLNRRLLVKLEAKTGREDTYRAHVVDKDSLNTYWNFDVEVRSIGELLSSREYDAVVLTGREGRLVSDVWSELITLVRRSNRVLVVFGSPRMGVDDILRSERLESKLREHLFINFVPEQGVETIRTEESILIVLSTLHLIRCCRH